MAFRRGRRLHCTRGYIDLVHWNRDEPMDFDAPCLHCRYNLRGLAGERVRCPECGGENERATLELIRDDQTAQAESRRLAAERRRREAYVARHEVGASLCAIGVGGAILCGLLGVLFPDFYTGILGPAFIVCGASYVVGLGLHAFLLRGRSGRWGALARHQLYAVPLVLLNIATVVITVVFFALAAEAGVGPCALILLVAMPLFLWYFRPFRFLADPARAQIERILPSEGGDPS
ncbi:MAG: hypothetical protein IT450_12370 [Phycisphaerales bacterium]|nr:hypothetical protein [Phycisphaerales bacterium]